VRAELSHADGQTYMTKPIVVFRNFSRKDKKEVARLVKLNTFGGGRHPGSRGPIPQKYTAVILSYRNAQIRTLVTSQWCLVELQIS
jgi:hypothetical protein